MVRVWDVATGTLRVLTGHTQGRRGRRLLPRRPADRLGERGHDDPDLGCRDVRAAGDPPARAPRLRPGVSSPRPACSRARRATIPIAPGAISPSGTWTRRGWSGRHRPWPRWSARSASAPMAGAWPPRAGIGSSGSGMPPHSMNCSRSSGHTGPVGCLTFSQDGNQLVSGGDDGSIRCWNAAPLPERPRHQPLRTFSGHEQPIYALALTPDGRHLVSAGEDHTARVWDVETGRQLLTYRKHKYPINALAVRPDGQAVATASDGDDRLIRIWDPRTGADLGQLRGHNRGDHRSGVPPRRRPAGLGQPGRHGPAVGHPHGRAAPPVPRSCLSGSTRSPSRPTAIGSPRPVRTARSTSGTWPADSCCTCCAATPSASWLSPSIPIPCIWPRQASMGRCGSGRPCSEPRSGSSTVPAAGGSPGAPTASIVAMSGAGGTLKVWDHRSGRRVLTLQGHADDITAAVFTPDGRRLVTAGWDGTIKLWDTALDDPRPLGGRIPPPGRPPFARGTPSPSCPTGSAPSPAGTTGRSASGTSPAGASCGAGSAPTAGSSALRRHPTGRGSSSPETTRTSGSGTSSRVASFTDSRAMEAPSSPSPSLPTAATRSAGAGSAGMEAWRSGPDLDLHLWDIETGTGDPPHLLRPPGRHLVGCDQSGRAARGLGVDRWDGARLGHRHGPRGPMLRWTPRRRHERRVPTRRRTPPLRRDGSPPPSLGHRDRPRGPPVRRPPRGRRVASRSHPTGAAP